MDMLAENDEHLKNNGWQTGTRAIFYQPSSPTGWGIIGSAHGRYLRVVDGVSGIGGGLGGSWSPSAPFNPTHNHVATAEGDHTHLAIDHWHRFRQTADAPVLGANGFFLDTNGLMQEANDLIGGNAELLKSYFPTQSTNNPSSAAGAHQHGVNNANFADFTFNYTNVVIAEKLTSSGYVDLTGFFFYGQKIVDTMFSTDLWNNDIYNRDRLMPNGNISVCSNPTAPIAWSKLNIHNDRFLVNNTPFYTTGGNSSPQSGIGFNHNHGMTSLGAHSHNVGDHVHVLGFLNNNNGDINNVLVNPSGNNLEIYTIGSNTGLRVKGETGSTSGTYDNVAAHIHVISTNVSNLSMKYLDVITIQKVSGTPPWAFFDYRASLAYKKLVSKQKLNTIGQTDDFIKYHTTPTGTKMSFFQSTAPLNWTQATEHHDRILRVVTGAGGGVGGSQGVGSGLSFVHAHTMPSHTHGHFSSNHRHLLATQSVNTIGTATGRYAYSRDGTLGNDNLWAGDPGGFDFYHKITKEVGEDITWAGLSDSHIHTHTVLDGGGIVNFAYANVILCEKN
jgi:hypothetical protein